MFSAGESSGDQHAANMFLELKKQMPKIKGIGMGGAKMQQAGIDISYDSAGIGVIGIFEVIKHYGEIRRALKQMKQLVASEKPDLLVCVDYKEFNLKLAQFAKQQSVKVLFYVSPQVWASRPGRVVTYGKAIDMMAVIFPFEVAYYEAESVPVKYVGHPSVDKVTPIRNKADDLIQFSLQDNKFIIGILPGSRINEINRMLPVMLGAAEKLAQSYKGVQFLLPQADSITDELLQSFLKNVDIDINVIKDQPYDVIQCCDVIMTTSGTATLEVSLLKVPMVIAYKLSAVTYFLAQYIVNIKYIGLPNIIAGKGIVKELIQHEATAENLAKEISEILDSTVYREKMMNELTIIKKKLGQGGGSKNMADLAVKMLRD
ncbi:MAG: lipid-A-disaccharide synthase [Methylococcales bacterium]|nr:lipid-A-disaccharide synthase [Methylococcales bacterium]